jgi:hypothetical protein
MNVKAASRTQTADHISNMDSYTTTGRLNHDCNPQDRCPRISASRLI